MQASVVITMLVLIAVVIVTALICVTCFKYYISKNYQTLKYETERFNIIIKNKDDIIRNKDSENLRLTEIIKNALEKNRNYNLDANIKKG